MHYKFSRFVIFTMILGILTPILVGCGKSEKAMQTPDGLSARQKREQKQAAGQ